MDKQLPNIFTYFDFRKYLEDYRRQRKCFDPGFTHSYICFRLGQRNSKSYFANVVNGTKMATAEFTNRFIELLELNDSEAHYFRLLVNYSQTMNPGEKEYYLQQLISRSATQCRFITEQEYDFYKNWYNSTIRAILDIYNFRDDYKALSDLIFPSVSATDVKNSLSLMKQLGLIKKNESGYYKPTDKTIKTGEFVKNELIRQYQMQCLELAKTILLCKTEKCHDISTNTMSISEECMQKIQHKIDQFRKEIRSLVQNDTSPADRVYQLNIQFFPNSEIIPGKKQIKETL